MLRLALIILLLCCNSVLATDLGNGVEYFKNPNNVGIGNKTPGARLDVNGDVMITTNGHVGQYLYHDLDLDTYLKFTDDDIEFSSGSETLGKFHEDGTQDYVRLGDGGDVDINLNNDLYTYGSSGNVSIGTTNNYGILTVEGNITLDEISAPSNTSGYGKVYVYSGDKELYFRASDQSAVKITNNGSLAGGSGSGEWTETNTIIHPSDNSGSQTVIVGGTNLGNGDIILHKNGSAIFNEQGIASSNFRIEGETEQYLFFTEASTNRVAIGHDDPDTHLDLQGHFTIRSATVAAASSVLSFKNNTSNGAENFGITSIVIDKPSSTAENDFLIAVIKAMDNTVTVNSIPSGWTLIGTQANSTGQVMMSVYWKKATGSEPSSYTFGLSESVDPVGIILRYNGSNLSSPIAGYASGQGTITDPSALDVDFPSLSGLADNYKVLRIVGSSYTGISLGFSDASMTGQGYTQRYSGISSSGNDFTGIYDKQESTSIGTIQGSFSSGGMGDTTYYISFTIALGEGASNTDPLEPDNGAAAFWLASSSVYGNNGDFLVRIRSDDGDKVIKIIDYNNGKLAVSNPSSDNTFNGLTLNGLTANRLVRTDANKKLISETTLFSSGSNVGIGVTSPGATLEVGDGTANFINGTNDILVADDLEVDDDAYIAGSVIATNFNGSTVNLSGTANVAKLLASGSVNGNTANFTKVLATGSVNGAASNFSSVTSSGTVNASKVLVTNNINGATMKATDFIGGTFNGAVIANSVVMKSGGIINGAILINSNIAKLVAPDGSPNPALEINNNGTAIFYNNIKIPNFISGNGYILGTDTETHPLSDGFRMRYEGHYFGTNREALIFDKTDLNARDPDGGIAFVNTGNDGVAEPSLTIDGNGFVEFYNPIVLPSAANGILLGTDVLSNTPLTDGFRVRRDENFQDVAHHDVILFEKTDGNNNNPDGLLAFMNTGNDGIAEVSLAIRGTGNIGIGIGDPLAKLAINGDLALDETSAPSNVTGYGKVYVDSSNKELYFRASDQSAVKITNNGSLANASGVSTIDDLSDAKADSYSVFLGSGSGAAHSGSNYSTALGISALNANTSNGMNNTALGYSALYSNIGADGNTAIGSSALLSNTSGGGNTATGRSSLYYNTTGYWNTATGYKTLESNTTGEANSALGAYALRNNTQGNGNTAIGEYGLYSNTTGEYNTALGSGSLYSNTNGDNNTAIGTNASRKNTTGFDNVSIGRGAAKDVTSGSNNTAVGNASLYYSITSARNTAVGYRSGYGSNGLSSFFNGTYLGYQAGSSLISGDNNILIGYKAGDNITNGDLNIIIGHDINGTSAMSSNQLNIGDTVYADMSTDQVSIGTTNNFGILTLEGSLALDETSAPSNVTGYGKVYVDSSSKELYFRASDQSAVKITNNGSLANSSEAIAINDLSDAKSDSYSLFLGSGSGAAHSGSNYSTALGISALNANTSNGMNNTALGYNSLYANTNGDSNTALGSLSLRSNLRGSGNTALGSNSLYNNTNGNFNTAAGSLTLYSNTTGNGNAAFGTNTLRYNTTGVANTAMGRYALYSNTTADANSAFGTYALNANTTGNYNSALGGTALNANTTGYYNTAVGYASLRFPETGKRNTAVGYDSGQGTSNQSFSNGVFLGYGTGLSLENGNNNIFVGYQAGDEITTGASNIIIGHNNDAPSNTASNQLDIGDTIYADMSTDQVSIGTTNNYETLTIEGGLALDEISAPSNVTGYGKVYVNSSNKELYFRASDQSAVKITNNGSLANAGGVSTIDDLGDAVSDVNSVFLGSGSGNSHSGSTYSTALGIDSLKNNNGNSLNNTAIGYQAMMSNNGGDYNTSVGYQSLYSNLKGSHNSAFGRAALYANTTGDDNTASGYHALYSNTTGYSNTSSGYQSSYSNTTGNNNTVSGLQALYTNTTGSYNNATGSRALQYNTTGSNNVAFGYYALNRSATGNGNTAIGVEALLWPYTSSSRNTALGHGAGRGTFNNRFSNGTLLGYLAGNGLTTGSNNIFLGYKAGDNITSGSNNLIIGSNADYLYSATASSQLNIGDSIYGDMSTDQISIGTTNNYGILTLEGTLALDEIAAPSDTTSGYGRIYVNSGNSKLYFRDDGGTNYNLTNGDAFSSSSYLRSDTSTSYTSGTLTVNSGTTIDINSTNVSIADTDVSFDGGSTTLTSTGAWTLTGANGSNINVNLLGVGDFVVDTNKLIVNNNGNVGIGYTTPNQLLSVNGAMSIKEGSAPSSSSNFGKLYANSSNSKLYFLDDSGTSYNLTNGAVTYAPGGSNKQLQYNNSGSFGGATYLYYNGSNLGIGTAAPQEMLHIHQNGSGNAFMQFTNNDTGSTSSDGSIIGKDGSEHIVIKNQESKDIIFSTNNTERMRIMSGGIVGIGIASPSTFKLELNGGDFGPSANEGVNLGGSNNRFNRLYTKEAFFGNNGGLMWGSSESYAYKTYFSLAQINNTTSKTLVDINGDVFSYSKTYKVTAHNPGTSTLTGAVAYFIGNGSSSFELFKAYEQGTGTEDIEFYLSSGVPKVRLYAGTTTRAVQLLIEESPIFGKDNYAFGPAQAFSSPTPGVINLKGRSSGAAMLRAIANSDTLYGETTFASTNGSGAAVDKWGVGALGDSHASGANRFYIYQYADRNDSSISRFRMIVSNNGNFHYNFMGSGVNDNYGKYVYNGVVAMKEETSAPTNSSNFGKLFIKSSNSKLYFLDDSGTSYNLTNGSTLGTSIAINDLTDGATDSTSIFLGNRSGTNDDGSNYNTALGLNGLTANTSGIYNTVMGYRAGQAITTGTRNTSVGVDSMLSVTNGSYNTALGTSAMGGTFGVEGSSNTAVGYRSLYQLDGGVNNTALGYKAGADSTYSNGNIFIGKEAGNLGTWNVEMNRNNNICIGNNTCTTTGSYGNSITIGNDIATPSSSKINIGNTIYGAMSTGNVGIGFSSPGAKLEVNGTTLTNLLYYKKQVTNNGTTATTTVDWNSANKQILLLNADTTLQFTEPPSTVVGTLVLKVKQSAAGSKIIVDFDSLTRWPGGFCPPITATAGAVDIITCLWDGTYYYCQLSKDYQVKQ